MKINKVIIILFTFCILISINELYASTITKEDIKENIEGTLADKVTYKDDNIMNIKYEEYEFEFEYDLTNNPTFSIYMNFKKDNTVEEHNNEVSNLIGLAIPFSSVAKEKNIDTEDAVTYNVFKILKISNILEDISNLFSEAFSSIQSDNQMTSLTPFETAKEYFNSSNVIDDTLFTINYSIIKNTEDEFNIKATMVIKEDQDFSIITSFIKELKDEEEKNNIEAKTTTTTTTKELPKAGLDNTLRNILIAVIGISIFVIILITVKDIKRYKKI